MQGPAPCVEHCVEQRRLRVESTELDPLPLLSKQSREPNSSWQSRGAPALTVKAGLLLLNLFGFISN